MTLVCDTGVVFAALERDDRAHAACAALFDSGEIVAILPSPVVVETDWLASARGVPAASEALLGSIEDESVLVASLSLADYARARALMRQYADLPLGLVDASVVIVAERLGQRTIATLDRRHFSVVRPLHVDAFELVP